MSFNIKIFIFITIMIMTFAVPSFAAEETLQEQILRISRNALKVPHTFTAASLHEAISTNDPSLYIISLQNEKEYAEGHIPGAIRIDLDLANPAAALKLLPRNKTIIVTDSNGQLSCQATLFLRQLGYDARNLLLGVFGWNPEYVVASARPQNAGLPIGKNETPLPPTRTFYSQPSGMDDNKLILQKTKEYALQKRPVIISPQAVTEMKGNAVIISLQTPEDYAYGHIAGAVNIPAQDFIKGSPKLLQLPKDKKIVVTCYIGHYSNIGALLLNQLGYEAYSLDWGLTGWNQSAFAKPLPPLQAKNSFPVERGEHYNN
ncbi:rhodanese-like domain-containing protein [Maridesulfovibrio sp.]|uniref:rhodanese-like domain-containing protein n=1 Tax=Maridesulfovibrio sp. TaxID=2795000 RepID=UPI0029CA5B79|nr:rhodanese-like domain-containing protein [Maridesulfovibrio sp.]